jgi:hypothetical protein
MNGGQGKAINLWNHFVFGSPRLPCRHYHHGFLSDLYCCIKCFFSVRVAYSIFFGRISQVPFGKSSSGIQSCHLTGARWGGNFSKNRPTRKSKKMLYVSTPCWFYFC